LGRPANAAGGNFWTAAPISRVMPSPLSLLALAFVAGIACGEWLQVGVVTAAASCAIAAGLAGLAIRRDRAVGTALIGLSLAVGALGAATARPPPADRLLQQLGDVPTTFEGRVSGLPEAAFAHTRLAVDLERGRMAGHWRSLGAHVRVIVRGDPLEPIGPDDHVIFRARLRAPGGFHEPGGPDGERDAAEAGVVAVAGVHAPPFFARRADVSGRGLYARVGWARARLRAVVAGVLGGDARALVLALVLGDRGEITAALDEAFRAAGVAHVLSVSGLHLAIAAFLFYGGLARILIWIPYLAERGLVRRLAAAAALPATVAYTLLTGAEVATVRACVVAAFFLGGAALGRRVAPADALASAALVILVVSPLMLFAISFQLSFAAALGTSILARIAPRPRDGGPATWPRMVARWALGLCIASAAAFVATAPICAWHFAQLQPAGIITNLVIVPLAELGVVPLGLSGALLGALPGLSHLGRVVLGVTGLLAQVMAFLVRSFAALGLSRPVAAPTAFELVLFYAALIALALPVARSARARARRVALVLFVVAGCSYIGRRIATDRSEHLVACFLDVGQGDAAVLELGAGKVAVIDGGGSFDASFDPGQVVIGPYLARRGIRRIDLMVLSHPHPDHANGLAYLAEHFEVGEVWTNGQDSAQPGTLRLVEVARRRGIPLGRPRPITLGRTLIEPLAPWAEGGIALDETFGENDNSLVVRFTHAGRRLLFLGDVEEAGEGALLGSWPDLAADAVKVPHHGSRTSSSEALVARTHPRYAVFSAGAHNRWGFPHAEVVDRWRAMGAGILRTDLDGAVTLDVDGEGRLNVATALPGPGTR
jgi:competence protein ComEC